jgi:O-antigen/teichoic acid export membrane protein
MLLPITFQFFRFQFDKIIFSEMIKFGLPYVPSGLAVVAMDLIDRFFLERMTSLEITGIYSAGYKLGMFMALFIAAFRFAWHPFFLSTSKQENAKQVFAKVLTYFVLACSFVFLGISLFIDEIVRFKIFGFTLFGEAYWESTVIVPLILISYIFYGVYVNFLVGVYLEKKTSMLPLITGAAALVNVIANLILIPFLGMMGSAWAKVLCYSTMAVLLYYKVYRIYFVQYEWGRIVRIAVAAIGIFLVQFYLLQFESWFLKLGLILIFFLILLFSGFLDKSEKKHLQSLFHRSTENA